MHRIYDIVQTFDLVAIFQSRGMLTINPMPQERQTFKFSGTIWFVFKRKICKISKVNKNQMYILRNKDNSQCV